MNILQVNASARRESANSLAQAEADIVAAVG